MTHMLTAQELGGRWVTHNMIPTPPPSPNPVVWTKDLVGERPRETEQGLGP